MATSKYTPETTVCQEGIFPSRYCCMTSLTACKSNMSSSMVFGSSFSLTCREWRAWSPSPPQVCRCDTYRLEVGKGATHATLRVNGGASVQLKLEPKTIDELILDLQAVRDIMRQ